MSLGTNRLCCAYAKAGSGKTSDMIYAVPYGHYIGPPNSTAPAETTVGVHLDDDVVFVAHDLDDAVIALEYVAEQKASGACDERTGVLVDDISVMSRNWLIKNEGKYGNIWDMWRDHQTQVFKIVDIAEHIDDIVCFTAHEQLYNDKKGLKGGPKFASGNVTEPFCGPFHEMLRVVRDPKALTEFQAAYECKGIGDPFMITKARCGMGSTKGPCNLAEMLRAAGLQIPRHPDHDWIEEWAQIVFEELQAGGEKQRVKILDRYHEALRKEGIEPLLIRWVLRDGLHRWIIRGSYREQASRP